MAEKTEGMKRIDTWQYDDGQDVGTSLNHFLSVEGEDCAITTQEFYCQSLSRIQRTQSFALASSGL